MKIPWDDILASFGILLFCFGALHFQVWLIFVCALVMVGVHWLRVTYDHFVKHTWRCLLGRFSDFLFRMPHEHQLLPPSFGGCDCDCHRKEAEQWLANVKSALAILEKEGCGACG